MFFALSVLPDTRHVSEDISEPATEDVAFVGRHLERFLDSIGEAISGETEVWEHGILYWLSTVG